MKSSSLSQIIIFVQKFAFSGVNIATPIYFWSVLTWNIFSILLLLIYLYLYI